MAHRINPQPRHMAAYGERSCSLAGLISFSVISSDQLKSPCLGRNIRPSDPSLCRTTCERPRQEIRAYGSPCFWKVLGFYLYLCFVFGRHVVGVAQDVVDGQKAESLQLWTKE